MGPEEVHGVLAHEVAHIANGDMVTMTLLQGIMNAFVMFFARIIAYVVTQRGGSRDDSRGNSYMLTYMVTIVLEIALGILGSIVTAWFSRQREFRADHGGATLAGKARMLAALRRLAANRELVDTQQPALATLKINGVRNWMGLLSTHPPLEQRIAALEASR
jgi:heat shock protein HtpX